MKNVLLLLTALLLILSSSVFSQEALLDTTFLDEVVVSATKTEHSIFSAPASVSVITKQKIGKAPVIFIDEALKNLTGVYTKRSKMADQTASVTLRGFSGDSRTLVLLDGLPMNDGYNQGVNWDAMPIDAIEKVEVLKGSFSSLYGGNAMGGVISITSSIPKQEAVTFKSNYGTYNTLNSSLSYSNRFLKEKLGLFLSVGQQSTDGYISNLYQVKPKSGQNGIVATGWEKTKNASGEDYFIVGDIGANYMQQEQITGKLVWDINTGSTLDLTYNMTNHEYGYRNPSSYLVDNLGQPLNNGTYTINDNGTLQNVSIKPYNFLSGSGNLQVSSYKLHYKTVIKSVVINAYAGYTNNNKWYTSASTGATEDGGYGSVNITNPNKTYIGNIQVDIPVKSHIFTVGADYRKYTASGEEWLLSNWQDKDSKTSLKTSMDGKQEIISPFAQAEISILKGLKSFIGIRYDYWKNTDGTSYSVSDANHIYYDDSNSSQFSPKLALVYTPEINLNFWKLKSIRASMGKSFRAPSLYNLYKTWQYGTTTYLSNPDLKSERTSSWETGISQTFFKDRTWVNFTYFHSDITNLIYNNQISTGLKKYENAGKGKIKGFELEIDQTLFPFLSVNFNITKQSTEITENTADIASVGKRFTEVPNLIYNFGLNFHKGPAGVLLTYNYTDKIFSSSNNSDTQQGVYGANDKVKLFDGKASYSIHKNINLSLAVNNILDREYYLYYKAPGRTYSVGVTAKF
jgi:iron complex outermembrane receptor protein